MAYPLTHDAVELAPEDLPDAADKPADVRRRLFARRSKQLSRRMLAGGLRERDECILFHRPVVRWFVKMMRSLGADEADMAQAAWVALLEAVDAYRANTRYTYLWHARQVLGQIYNYDLPWLISNETVSLDRPEFGLFLRNQALPGDVRPPIISWGALSSPEVERAATPPTDSYGICNAPERRLVIAETANQVRAAVSSLDQVKRRVVRGVYGIGCEPRTPARVATDIGRTHQRVHQLLQISIQKLWFRLPHDPQAIPPDERAQQSGSGTDTKIRETGERIAKVREDFDNFAALCASAARQLKERPLPPPCPSAAEQLEATQQMLQQVRRLRRRVGTTRRRGKRSKPSAASATPQSSPDRTSDETQGSAAHPLATILPNCEDRSSFGHRYSRPA